MTQPTFMVVAAPAPIRWYLRRTGFWAITLPLWTPTIYVLAEHQADSALLAHELVHVEQIRRMGRVKFLVTYLWYQLVYGYQENPLEIEARAAERQYRDDQV